MRTSTNMRAACRVLLAILCLHGTAGADDERGNEMQQPEAAAFASAEQGKWKEVFHDPCTGDWQERWFLDGRVASVSNSPEGMQLTAGPRFLNDAHHMVLWTQDSFEGDLKIEYDFTRLDFEKRCVNILYVQASGSGKGPFVEDIAAWSRFREVPAMRLYFNHMHAYHISYAAYPNFEDEAEDYIRARRYMPGGDGLAGTELKPDYSRTGLFAPGVPHRITVIKRHRNLYMRIVNPGRTFYCHWENRDLPPIEKGRVGLRQMYTRSARYGDFRISVETAE